LYEKFKSYSQTALWDTYLARSGPHRAVLLRELKNGYEGRYDQLRPYTGSSWVSMRPPSYSDPSTTTVYQPTYSITARRRPQHAHHASHVTPLICQSTREQPHSQLLISIRSVAVTVFSLDNPFVNQFPCDPHDIFERDT